MSWLALGLTSDICSRHAGVARISFCLLADVSAYLCFGSSGQPKGDIVKAGRQAGKTLLNDAG